MPRPGALHDWPDWGVSAGNRKGAAVKEHAGAVRPIVDDVEDWLKHGYGHSFEFFATADDIRELLAHKLPPRFAPYKLVWAEEDGEFGHSVKVPHFCDVERLPTPVENGEFCNFWLWSGALTAPLPLVRGHRVETICGLNGLVLVQSVPVGFGSPIFPSSVGVLGRVWNQRTGEGRTYGEYVSIFQSLKRQLNKMLCYATNHIGRDGTVTEVKYGWTEDAAREYDALGEASLFRPGRRLEPKGRAARRP